MAKTPFQDLKSEDILSAHISGLQHSVNKIEDVLNMTTSAKSGHTLVPVADQADSSTHRIIFEGTVRNWLTSPAPKIYRNGTVVATSEYRIQHAYGVVVFNAPQPSSAVITADFAHIDGSSVIISNLNTLISEIDADVSQANTNVAELSSTVSGYESRIQALEAGGGGSGNTGGTATIEAPSIAPEGALIPSGNYIPTSVRDAVDLPKLTTEASMASQALDAVPIFIYEKTTVTKVKFNTGPTTATGNVIVGIYSNENSQPKKLLGETSPTSIAASTAKAYEPELKAPLVLTPGLYWVVRYHSSGSQKIQCWNNAADEDKSKMLMVQLPEATGWANVSSGLESYKVSGAIRSGGQGVLTTLPTTFPPVKANGMTTGGSQYLVRDDYGIVWLYKQ